MMDRIYLFIFIGLFVADKQQLEMPQLKNYNHEIVIKVINLQNYKK